MASGLAGNQPTTRASINDFLREALGEYAPATLVAGDASFRKYYRTHKDGVSYIIMDAPPDKENVALFMQVATAFSQAGINVPHIIEDDVDNGYLLMSDFGDAPLQPFVCSDPAHWLPITLDCLFELQHQGGQHLLELPLYDDSVLLRELRLFPEWFVHGLLNTTLEPEEYALLDELNQLLINSATQQPQVWVHRDYHSRNLMKVGESQLGVIDFQDAMFGAITYDLASILKDCYVRHPKSLVQEQLQQYYLRLVAAERYHRDFEQFERDFDWMGLQRHLKVLGVFARLSIRDGKHTYLNDLPLVFDYVFDVMQKYTELQRYLPIFKHLGEQFERRVLS